MKNFTNNFKQLTSRLSARWLIMVLMLLVGTSSAWGWNLENNSTVYFDISAYPDIKTDISTGKKLLLFVGHSSHSTTYELTHYSGNIYRVENPAYYGGCTNIAFATNSSVWGGEGNSVSHRLGYIDGHKTEVLNLDSNISGSVGFVGNPLSRENSYTPVINNAGFFDLNAWNIKYNGAWIDGGINANSSHDLGELTSAPNITGLLVNVWKNSSGDVCGVSAKYKVNDGTLKDLDFSDDNGWDNEASGSNTNQTIKDESISLDLPSTPGQYTVTITFTASINNNGQGNCQESAEMTAVITYSIKGYSLGGWLNGSNKQAFQQTWVLTPEGDGIYTHNYNNFDGKQYFQIYEDDNTCWGRGKGAYDDIGTSGSSVLTKGTCDEKVGITLTNETNYVFTFEIDKNDNTKGTLSISPACTNPSKPTLSKTSDTTCPDVDYTLPTATNKGTYTQKWYNSNGTEVTSPVKVSTQTTYTTKLIDGTCESDATEFTLYVTSKPTAPEIEAANNQICEGDGTATISIQEYSSEYTYALYNEGTLVANHNFNSDTGEFTISVAGKYKVTATESTCTLESDKSNEVTINYYTAPVIDEDTYSVTNETLCNQNNNNDGIISLNPTYGVSYSLSKDEITYDLVENKWSYLTAGTYTLTATLDACQKLSNTKEITVGLTDNTAIKTDISITADKNPICYGTKAKLTCTEISNASYLWNTKETTSEITTENLTSNTTFRVEVSKTENGCTTTKETSITINVNSDVLKPNLTEESTNICSGSSVNLGEFAPEGTVWYENQACTEPLEKTVAPTDNKTYYAKAKDGECLSSEYTELTINVTTTPTITGATATQPNKEITLSSAAGASTNWITTGGTLTTETGTETVFTTTSNGNYTITASNTENDITCSATHEIVVNDKFYIYIRRPKSGDAIYSDWYGKTNEADKGGAAWFKKGVPDDNNLSDTNYGGDGPLTYFEDCNGYIWDGYQGVTGNFYIHAPNTGGQDGWATFTKAVNVTSLTTDKYYIISSWTPNTKGANLAEQTGNNIPTRIPEVAVPVLSIDPVSGIICQNAEATITVTNPEDGVTYTLNYEGKDQENPIQYKGAEEVKYTVSEAGTYLVKAETTSGACKGNSSSSPKEVKVITTAVSFSQSDYYTTPWIPVTVQINVPKGYEYTYSDAALTSITPETDAPIKKANDTAYTYTFPRPTSWGIGNSANGDGFGEKTYTVNASIKNAEECGSASATVHLQDEGNDNCTTTNP